MVSEDAPDKILYDGLERFSDLCPCGHTRADHVVDPRATTVFAVSDCNRQHHGKHRAHRGSQGGMDKRCDCPKCACKRFGNAAPLGGEN